MPGVRMLLRLPHSAPESHRSHRAAHLVAREGSTYLEAWTAGNHTSPLLNTKAASDPFVLYNTLGSQYVCGVMSSTPVGFAPT